MIEKRGLSIHDRYIEIKPGTCIYRIYVFQKQAIFLLILFWRYIAKFYVPAYIKWHS